MPLHFVHQNPRPIVRRAATMEEGLIDLHTLLVATKRFDGEALVWPPTLRVDVRFCGGDDVPPDVFMQRCTKGFLREVSLIGDVDSAFLQNSEIEKWARMVCTGSFARSLWIRPQTLCGLTDVCNFHRLAGRVSLRFAEAVKHMLHATEWLTEVNIWTGACPAFTRRVDEIRVYRVAPEIRATMFMLAFTPVYVAAALCDELRVPYPLRMAVYYEDRVEMIVDDHPSRMCMVKQVRLAKLVSNDGARVAIEGWL